jgi:hypothetical protein
MESGRTMILKLQISFVLLLLVLEIGGKIPKVLAYYEEEELEEWWLEDDWGQEDIYSHLECSTIFQQQSEERTRPPIYTLEMWMTMRRAYHDILGDYASMELAEQDGFFLAVEVKDFPEDSSKGRSVYAAQDIQQGDHLWTGARQVAKFDSGTNYKRFLASLSKDMACDVLAWAYVQVLGEQDDVRENARICVSLDGGSFMNSVEWPEEETVDAGCLPEWNDLHPGGCQDNLYALRDIQKGQEILMDWAAGGSSFVLGGWEWFGLVDHYDEEDAEEEEYDNEEDAEEEEYDDEEDAEEEEYNDKEDTEEEEYGYGEQEEEM